MDSELSTKFKAIKTVNIIEDDKTIRNNLTRYLKLEDDIEIGIASDSIENYFELLHNCDDDQSTTLLLDIGLPGISGLEAIPGILKANPEIDIIILTTFEEESKILEAMCLGAVAYLSKRTSLSDIAQTIRIVHQGGSYMSPMIARDIFNYVQKSNKNDTDSILRPRQLQVLKGMVDGKSHIIIGQELFISPETVRSHVKLIYKALQVKNKAEAITKYLRGRK